MFKKVACVELTIYEHIFPIVSGYLQAYAGKDPEIRKAFVFEHISTTVKIPERDLVARLRQSGADVFAFSCYVWNMALVRRLVARLMSERPDAFVILGGPQVMHHGGTYLDRRHEKLVLCNGEGERTFAEFLREIAGGSHDFGRVRGLTFYRDGDLVTTERHERLIDLDEIPSPYLTGVFKKGYTMCTYETNRGCPFSCGFCYWGAATNSKVLRFSDERVKAELTWLSENNCVFIYIADANWGILPRDIELTRHIAECARRYKMPNVVYYSAAKNKPERLTEITEIFSQAGIVTSQPVSLQTMNPESLALIDRSNIKLSSYIELQQRLTEKRISSFTELIWPLPGETLASMKRGVGRLCDAQAGTIIIYPHLLLNNTTLDQRREELGLTVEPVDDGIGEVRIVMGTRDVSRAEFDAGMRFFYALHLLYNSRAIRLLARHLIRAGVTDYVRLVDDFADYCLAAAPRPSIVEFCEKSIMSADFYDVFNYGKVVHLALHAHREGFERLIREFVSSRSWWADEVVQTLFALDSICMPYVYSDTPLTPPARSEHVEILAVHGRAYIVRIPDERLARSAGADIEIPADGAAFRVDHDREQYPFMSGQSLDHNAGYCHGMILRIESIWPTCRVESKAGESAADCDSSLGHDDVHVMH